MNWNDLEGKTIVSVVPDQEDPLKYGQEDCWTYGVKLTFSDGTGVVIEGLSHIPGGIDLKTAPEEKHDVA